MSNDKLGQEPSFPIDENYMGNYGPSTNTYFGVSKRFYAACAAMQGFLSGFSEELKVNGGYVARTDFKDIAEWSYQMADELLKQENQ